MAGTVDTGSASVGTTAAKETTSDNRQVHSEETYHTTKKPRTESVLSSEKSGEEKEKKAIEFDIKADAAEDKGSRHNMEDASSDSPGNLSCAHFAIYDGHGAANYAQKNLHANVLSAGLPRELMDIKAAKRAILDRWWVSLLHLMFIPSTLERKSTSSSSVVMAFGEV